MAWTTPRTWVSGETVTAQLMNLHIRDNLNILKTGIFDDGTIDILQIPGLRTGLCSADLTKNNDAALADIPGVSFPIEVGERLAFVAYLFGSCDPAANWRFAVTAPAAPTAIRYGVMGDGGPLGTGTVAVAGDPVFLTATGVGAEIVISGVIENGANAGTVQIQMAQKVADVSDAKIRQDSFVRAQLFS